MVGEVAGYSGMMERAEERTEQRLEALISDKITLLDGRIFNTAGDATSALFPTAIGAVRCAFEIRSVLAGERDQDSEKLQMRFGIHVADVDVRGDDLVGDGVDLAARIQQAADPDSIDVSSTLFEHIRRNSPFIFDALGERSFENISEPIQLYRLRSEMGSHRLQLAPTRSKGTQERRPSSIAVLPFRVGGEDHEQRFLAEGLTDELIVELGRFRRMFVSSRTASFAVGETQQDPVQVGDALSVRYVLAGQVRRLGDRVRISLTLSETETGSVVWSDKITRPFDELLDLLDETVSKIAATVFGRVEDAGMVAARRRPPQNMTAFECLLRGLDHHRLGGVTDDNVHEAIKWFDKAIAADPNFAAAYAWRVCAAYWLPGVDDDRAEGDILEVVEHGGGPAALHLVRDRLEVSGILLPVRGDIEDEVAALIAARWDHPILVRREHEVDAVADLNDVGTLALDHDRGFGDERLERSLVLFVASKERLVSKDDDGVAEVQVEISDEVLRRAHMNEMLPPELPEQAGEDAFADPLAATHDNGDMAGLAGVLHAIGHPADEVVTGRIIAVANVLADVGLELRPGAGCRIDAEPLPEVVDALGCLLARQEMDAVPEDAPRRVREPGSALWDYRLADADLVAAIEILEILELRPLQHLSLQHLVAPRRVDEGLARLVDDHMFIVHRGDPVGHRCSCECVEFARWLAVPLVAEPAGLVVDVVGPEFDLIERIPLLSGFILELDAQPLEDPIVLLITPGVADFTPAAAVRVGSRKNRPKERTITMSKGRPEQSITSLIERNGNVDDLIAFMQDRNLPVDDIEANNIAEQLLREKPEQGYLTISNALQWRLQYGRVIQQAGAVSGIRRIR
jgi:TolB-like protein